MGFIEQIAGFVQKYAPKYGICVCSPIIAQAVLESGAGTSELARNAHNYFGLKYRAGRCPTACGIYYKIGSEQNPDGTYSSSGMQWMKFSNMEDGVHGYFDFINIPNYANLKGVTNPKTYLENIKKDGYATSLKYTENLMAVISKYNLTQYDNLSTGGVEKMTYKVAIDAGHGSNTAGKRTPDGYREHWINVRCANFFDNALKRCGLDTLKVGWNDTNANDDADVALSTRQYQIKNSKCDISVSWHANAYGDGKSYNSSQGIETLIHSDASKAKNSSALATKVHNYLVKGTKQKNRGVKKQNLAMCNCSAMGTDASILIEIGFMTNEYEAELLKTDAFCLECAEEAAQGVCEYFNVPYVKGNSQTSRPTPGTSNQLYRIRKSWNDASSQLGAYSSLDRAKKAWKVGYYVFDINGNVVYPIPFDSSSSNIKQKTYQVKLLDNLNIRKTPNGAIVQQNGAKKGYVYTIVETQGTWGRLMSGSGWISVSDKYVKKV